MAKQQQQIELTKERTTFYLSPDFKKKMKIVAALSDLSQTEIIADALTDYFAKWEKKNGKIPGR